MKKYILILFLISNCFGQPPEWVELPEQAAHFKFYKSASGKNKWIGVPDANYVWEGDRLSWEREIVDEQGNPRTIKTYKQPIEIIAKFKPETKVYGVDKWGKIEKAAFKKFGGSLKGFVWLDNVSGGGEVILPFTAEHIFIAKGDRLNPVLTELSTDTSADNFYEIVDGKTHVYVKSFSGIGGAAGAPSTLIAHWPMNEDTASDNDELVTNGDFANWSTDDPDDWTVVGEVGADPMVNEVGTGEGHGGAGTGMCNLYTSDGTLIYMYQTTAATTVVGRRYRVSIKIDTITGTLSIYERVNTQFAIQNFIATGTYTWTFVATDTTCQIAAIRGITALCDITFDDVSLKLCAVEDSSGNDHDGLLQKDTSAAHVAGKINGAFDFDGSSDFIEIADHADFTFTLTPFSISAWVKLADTPIAYSAVVDRQELNSGYSLNVHSDRKVQFWIGDGTDWQGVTDATTALQDNIWYHIVGRYDGTNLSVFVNGNKEGSDVAQSAPGSLSDILTIGVRVLAGPSYSRYFEGTIDNVMIFSVELTPDEVKRLYNNNNGTEILSEIDSVLRPRRSNTSPLGTRARYEFP